MLTLTGGALYLVLIAAFFFLLYSVVNRAVLNALRTHAAESSPVDAGPSAAGPPHAR